MTHIITLRKTFELICEVEITPIEQNIEKRMKKNEDSLRDPWDSIKLTNTHIFRE